MPRPREHGNKSHPRDGAPPSSSRTAMQGTDAPSNPALVARLWVRPSASLVGALELACWRARTCGGVSSQGESVATRSRRRRWRGTESSRWRRRCGTESHRTTKLEVRRRACAAKLEGRRRSSRRWRRCGRTETEDSRTPRRKGCCPTLLRQWRVSERAAAGSVVRACWLAERKCASRAETGRRRSTE